jgi:hypothetical protein
MDASIKYKVNTYIDFICCNELFLTLESREELHIML